MTTQDRPIDFHYWPTPNGWKVAIMLEELGAPYAARFVDIGKGAQFAPDFLAISPNNRMPAIVDPEGPDGAPISVFESGAILLYLARKFRRFMPEDERARVTCEEWLMWQMGGLGPMCGQLHHFRLYAPEPVPYAIGRYDAEARRLYGVLDRRLDGRDFIAGPYSIADMASVPWIARHDRQEIALADYPNVAAWYERVRARAGVERGFALGSDGAARSNFATDDEARRHLFGGKS